MAVNLVGDGSADGVLLGASGAKVGFYGTAPVSQRASNSIHLTSNVSAYSATTASALIGAFLTEVAATLVGLGVWT